MVVGQGFGRHGWVGLVVHVAVVIFICGVRRYDTLSTVARVCASFVRLTLTRFEFKNLTAICLHATRWI